MSTPFANLTQNQKSQVQSVDQIQTQIATEIANVLLPMLTRQQAVWTAAGATLGLLDPTEPIARASATQSAFANQTLTVGDHTNYANFYATLLSAISNETNLGYIGQMIGPENE